MKTNGNIDEIIEHPKDCICNKYVENNPELVPLDGELPFSDRFSLISKLRKVHLQNSTMHYCFYGQKENFSEDENLENNDEKSTTYLAPTEISTPIENVESLLPEIFVPDSFYNQLPDPDELKWVP